MHTITFYLSDGYESALPWNVQSLYLGTFKQTKHDIVTLLKNSSPVHHHFECVAHRGCSRTCERMKAHIASLFAVFLHKVHIAHRLIKRGYYLPTLWQNFHCRLFILHDLALSGFRTTYSVFRLLFFSSQTIIEGRWS